MTVPAGSRFDVLLTHESPRDAVLKDSGSEGIGVVIAQARPAFAFFGHYGSRYGRVEVECRKDGGLPICTGFEMRRDGSTAEAGSVGLLTWGDGVGKFRYLDDGWLRTFTRHNWRHR